MSVPSIIDLNSIKADWQTQEDLDEQTQNTALTMVSRYTNQVCPKATRVQVSSGREWSANWVNEDILSMAPTSQGFDLFEETLMEHDVPIVFMLTPLCENWVPKAWNYTTQCTIKDVDAFLASLPESVRATIEAEGIKIQSLETPKGHRFVHVWYNTWSDHHSPTNAAMDALLHLKTMMQPFGPALIHCSAGLGRSGCFAFCAAAQQLKLRGEHVDAVKLLTSLRKQRPHLVQSKEQWKFCLEYATCP